MAAVQDLGLTEQGSNNLACAVLRVRLTAELQNGEWGNIENEGLEITGWHFLEKKDGTVNQPTIEQLKAALGWDGRDLDWLEDTDLAGVELQVSLEWESWNGKDRLKVQWLDPADADPNGGGVPHADEGTRRKLKSRLGSKLRALSGGSPMNAPAATGKPSSSAPPKRKTPPPASNPAAPSSPSQEDQDAASDANTAPAEPPADSTEEEAWAAFCEAAAEAGVEGDELNARWFAFLSEQVPGKDVEAFAPADWGKVKAEAAAAFCPF